METPREGPRLLDRLRQRLALPGLHASIERTRRLFERDQALGIDHVDLPHALMRKYPGAGKELKWQFVFASWNLSIDPRTGRRGRHHRGGRSVISPVDDTSWEGVRELHAELYDAGA